MTHVAKPSRWKFWLFWSLAACYSIGLLGWWVPWQMGCERLAPPGFDIVAYVAPEPQPEPEPAPAVVTVEPLPPDATLADRADRTWENVWGWTKRQADTAVDLADKTAELAEEAFGKTVEVAEDTTEAVVDLAVEHNPFAEERTGLQGWADRQSKRVKDWCAQ